MKKIFATVCLVALVSGIYAQSGTNSPYSQYGLGALSEQSTGFNRGMNGLGIGFHEHNQVNTLNPASYAYVDSLSFIFDAGVSGHITNYSEGNVKVNANNANFEYVVAGFRMAKNFGLSFGLLPYANVGYSFGSMPKSANSSVSYQNTYYGEGGFRQVYIGAGWKPFRGLAIGVNAGYLWGDYDRSVINSYSDSYVNTLAKYYTVSVSNYKLDFGVQYTQRLSSKDELTLGLTYSLGHKLNADPECMVVSKNAQTGVADTTVYSVKNGLELPSVYGVGLMWNHANKWKIGADYQLQKWSGVVSPEFVTNNGKLEYVPTTAAYKNRHKLTLGGEFCPEERGRNFFKRIHYRLGASYATDYLKINGQDGPKEMSVSAGFGIPIVNGYNNRSLLNISAQWARQSSSMFITENTFRINIGLTFNERWFAKWKME